MFDQFTVVTDPVGDSVALSAIFAALPLLTLFVLLGVLKMKAWLAGLISLARRPAGGRRHLRDAGRAGRAAGTEGAAFGFFPILWIVINAIWVYNLTVDSGHFDVLRRSFERVSPDMRIQAIIIAFCFGALLEALAGLRHAGGDHRGDADGAGLPADPRRLGGADRQHRAGRVRRAGHPDRHAGTVTGGANDDPRLTVDTLGAMVGRQTPILALVVPLMLVALVDGRRGIRQTWPAAAVAGVTFGLAQFVAANYISVPLTDIVASLVSAAAVVLLVRVWRPVSPRRPRPRAGGRRPCRPPAAAPRPELAGPGAVRAAAGDAGAVRPAPPRPGARRYRWGDPGRRDPPIGTDRARRSAPAGDDDAGVRGRPTRARRHGAAAPGGCRTPRPRSPARTRRT